MLTSSRKTNYVTSHSKEYQSLASVLRVFSPCAVIKYLDKERLKVGRFIELTV